MLPSSTPGRTGITEGRRMGRHRSGQPAAHWSEGRPGRSHARRDRRTVLWVGLAVLGVVAVASTAVAVAARQSAGPAAPVAAPPGCERVLRVVTAASFEPVLNKVGETLAEGADCVGLDTV